MHAAIAAHDLGEALAYMRAGLLRDMVHQDPAAHGLRARRHADLDAATQQLLNRGARLTELMKQPQYSPLSVAEMAISLYAANEGYLDDVDVKKVVDFEAAMQSGIASNNADLLDKINESGDFDDDIAAAMKSALDNFKSNGVY